eukprot:8121761-Pyramimonas_sp.AAC.1
MSGISRISGTHSVFSGGIPGKVRNIRKTQPFPPGQCFGNPRRPRRLGSLWKCQEYQEYQDNAAFLR